MEIINRLQIPIDFVERNLREDTSVKDIAFASCYSKYHFQRLFKEYTGLSVMDYVRKRRLSAAALELCYRDKRGIDVALDCHFSYYCKYIEC